ncbi:polysaccharide lyase family 7 protein [Sabulilitoribacter multivorans]|uniref:Polysaccharide lyase family 7 protein n=1 Tax=Flaviramulus multivorans TaxID=1304750 RepID=A0ABS9IG03_9FLAO|nr:polysaccharide lyase family 7 protein [Flaviramulus multivorans]MCF7559488.1 polysaccharide lyase family 7 protein [Flaviramulus multivorans]
MKLKLPKLFRNIRDIFYLKTNFKSVLTLCFALFTAMAFSQTYNAPYEIPKFQDFIGECKLQGPTSSTEATQSELINGYSSSSFYVADVDKMAFNQSGSSNRTELRYLTNWTLSQGDRSMHARIDIVQQTCDQVTVMQIHDDANAGSGPNKPLLRIYKHNNKTPNNHIWAVYKTDNTGNNNAHVDLGADPGGYFNVDIRLVNGNMIIDFEGVEKVNVDVSYWTFPSYWKAGVYLQDNGEATAYFDQLYTGTPSGTNASPSVSITSPSNGASFNDGDNVTISADATDSDGSVSQVEFFVNGSSVGIDTSSPYSTNWTIGVGSYDITAVATDNESASSSSSAITITGNSVGPSTELYVSNIETGTQNAGKGKKHGVATVTVLDDAGAPVNGATVSGTFNGTFNESVSGSTSSDGTVVLITSATAKGGVNVDLCVDDVTHSTLVYNSALNIITCTGSSMKIGQSTKDKNSKTDNIAFVIYPNPTVEMVTVKLGLDEKSQFYARVISLDGKVLQILQPQILGSGNHQIDMDISHLRNGIYFLESVLNGEKRVSRIVKK